MNKPDIVYYICPICTEEHESEEVALNCCELNTALYYICPICKEEYLTYEVARHCCKLKTILGYEKDWKM